VRQPKQAPPSCRSPADGGLNDKETAQADGGNTGPGWLWQLPVQVGSGLIHVGMVGITIVMVAAIAWWLMRPAKNGTIAVAATAGALTLEVLCGERLIWDLGPGRLVRRSSEPGKGISPEHVKQLTMTLLGGARAHVESTGPGILHIEVARAKPDEDLCGGGTAIFQIAEGENSMQDDANGIYYAAEYAGMAERRTLSFPLSGHILLGQAVQHGAGWTSRPAGVLESGTVTLRVVPTFSDERITLNSELLDEGSLLDTHACLDTHADSPNPCPSRDASPATGFVRAAPEGGLKVQLYARGPVGVQAFSAAKQQQLTVPNSIALWHSERLRIWIPVLAALLTFGKHLSDLSRFLSKCATARCNPRAGLASAGNKGDRDPPVAGALIAAGGPESRKKVTDAAIRGAALLLLVVGALGMAPSIGRAEPVEIKQEQYTGAGYSFRRGTSCLVVTANHVVKEMGVPITILDRTGAHALGSRTLSNESMDLALVTLPDNSPVACTARWPDSAWMRSASFGSKSEFRAIRHYSGGQEVIVYLKHAGGDKDRITLAPTDAMTIRESDSGSIVELDGKLAGIVQSIATETQRVSVLRFDRIDDLVGDRFRSSAAGRVVSFAGVLVQGRPKPDWSTYVQSWISEKTGSTVVPTATAATAVPKPICDVKIDVVAWDQVAAPNPELSSAELQQNACGKKGWLYEQLCKQAKETKATAPKSVPSQKISVNVIVTPTGAAPLTKLVQGTHTPTNSKMTRPEIENLTLQAAVGPALTELFDRGGCN